MVRIAMTVVAVLVGFVLSGVAQAAESYKVDPVHSMILFRVKHMNAGYVYGRFNNPGGAFTVDKEDPSKSSFQAQVATKNIDTANPKRDDHLRSPDFFNAEQFPTLSFKSTAVKKVDDKHYEVTGDLTVHGQTRPVTVTLEHVGESPDRRGGTRTGFHGVFNLKRSDFGITFMPEGLGEEVQVIVAFEGTSK